MTDGAGVVKRPWSAEEDELLVAAVSKYGASRWSMIAMQLSSGRVGKQCRERWTNHLCPEVKKGEWAEEEDRALMMGVAVHGTRWCEIIKAPELGGRTDNSIKNRFYALQRKMRAKQMGVPVGGRPKTKPSEPVAEPVADMSRTGRIVAIAQELAFSTDEFDRDVLIEQLTATLHEESDLVDAEVDVDASHDDGALSAGETAPREDPAAADGLELTSAYAASAELLPSGIQIADFLMPSPPRSGGRRGARTAPLDACCESESEETEKLASLDVDSLPELADDSSDASSGSRSHTASPTASPAAGGLGSGGGGGDGGAAFSDDDDAVSTAETDFFLRGDHREKTRSPENKLDAETEKASTPPLSRLNAATHRVMGTTAAVLGGRLAHKALLSPLRLPLQENMPDDSPKRVRTTPGGAWLPGGNSDTRAPWHTRRPSALVLGHSPNGASPNGHSPSTLVPSPPCGGTRAPSDASPTGAREPSPLCAVTGTEEPGAVRGGAAWPASGTKEPDAMRHAGLSPSSVFDADQITFSDFSDLFFDAGELVPASCGKRKAAQDEWL